MANLALEMSLMRREFPLPTHLKNILKHATSHDRMVNTMFGTDAFRSQ